jgi:hypothetical protein
VHPYRQDQTVPETRTPAEQLRRMIDHQDHDDYGLLYTIAVGVLAERDQLAAEVGRQRPRAARMTGTIDDVNADRNRLAGNLRIAAAQVGFLNDIADGIETDAKYRATQMRHRAEGIRDALTLDADPEPLSHGESVTSWHTVRLFDGPALFEPDTTVRQYEVTHPDECATLPVGAVCWFTYSMRQEHRPPEWPTEVGTYRVRGTTRIVGGYEEPDYADILEVDPVGEINADEINRSVAPELKTEVFRLLGGLHARLKADGHIPAKAEPDPLHVAPEAVLLVDANNGAESWTGKQWNRYVDSAERANTLITARILDIKDPTQTDDVAQEGHPNLRTPDRWCDHYDITIVDPTGWADQTSADWAVPIGLPEFQRRAAASTVDGPVGVWARMYDDLAALRAHGAEQKLDSFMQDRHADLDPAQDEAEYDDSPQAHGDLGTFERLTDGE